MNKQGTLEVITGPMFSGKTEAIAKHVKFALLRHQSVEMFMSATGTRDTRTLRLMVQEIPVQILPKLSYDFQTQESLPDLIVIDEAQFIKDYMYISRIEKLVEDGAHIILAGLDTDYQGEPFGFMPIFMALADEVTKLKAVCFKCHSAYAGHTYRIPKENMSTDLILVGDKKTYEARCRRCFNE